MKKLFALLLVLVFMVSLVACGSQKLTMRKLIDANQSKTLLETHDSIYVQNKMDGEVYTEYYLTDTYSYENHGTWSMYVTNDTGYRYDNGMYGKIVCLTRDGLVDYADYRAGQYEDVVMSQESLVEKIQSVAETDNQITLTSFMNEKNLEKVVGVESMHSYEATYVIDAETYGIMTIDATVTQDDGTTTDALMECSYNGEMPEGIKVFLEYENQTENLRTVTLVFHVGTDKEKAECIQVPKGLSLWLIPGDAAEGFSVYADAACTVPHESNGDYTSDITVYIK